MSRIIDNENEKLSRVLLKEFARSDEIAIASAYFNVGGYGLIKDAIRNKPLKFLIGRPQDESISFEEQIIQELEENEDNPEYYNLMIDAINFFSDSRRQVRKKTGAFFHGKAYIGASPSLATPDHGIGIVGSSNFTYAGLMTNNELNVMNTDREVLGELSKWFNEKWESSEEYKETFLDFLRNYTVTHTPYEVAAKALYEYYKNSMEESEKSPELSRLYKHQVLSIIEAKKIMDKYGGVIIADSTGLGKTRVMIRLAHDAKGSGKKVLLIAPKSVLETTWKKEMEDLDTHIHSVNSEYVSADPDAFVERYSGKYNFIVVDEAHYFRSPSSNRYKALRDLIVKNSAQVVLGTATPVNNSLMDIYSLLSLYLDEGAIIDITGDTLKGFFSSSQKRLLHDENIDITQILERFVVRHSRQFAKAFSPNISFPTRSFDDDPLNRYSGNIDYQDIWDKLEKIKFTPYNLAIDRFSELRLPDGSTISKYKEAEKKEQLKKLVKTIIELNIIKRLESSFAAYRDTLLSLKEYLEAARSYAKNKKMFLPRKVQQDPLFDFDEELPDPDQIFSKEKYSDLRNRCTLSDEEVSLFAKDCDEDIAIIDNLLNMIPSEDQKMRNFVKRIANISETFIRNNETDSNGVVIFSQYTSTAKYIYEELKKAIKGRIYLVTGNDVASNDEHSRKSKADIVSDFQEKGGFLVSTDVLSEGQNLQIAQYVVNYDFPWNPVVLIQRTGRVDRLGSKYKSVYILNILPINGNAGDPSTIEYFIGLMRKLYSKLQGIKASIGIDSPVLGEDEDPKNFGSAQLLISKKDPNILEYLTKQAEQFSDDPKDRLSEIRDEMGIESLRSIPMGIGAVKKAKRDAIFSLFTDGDNFYWRMKYLDGNKETVTSVNEIINSLLERHEMDVSGQFIEYSSLIDKLKDLKVSLNQELEKIKERERTSQITKKVDKRMKAIYEKLSQLDAELATQFLKMPVKDALIQSLYEKLNFEDFISHAKSVLPSTYDITKIKNESNKTLKRVCWCLFERVDHN